MNGSEREVIPAGIRVHIIKSPRGSYIRTPDGRFFAIRQPTTVNTIPKPVPIIPPPPPSASNLLDELLFGRRIFEYLI